MESKWRRGKGCVRRCQYIFNNPVTLSLFSFQVKLTLNREILYVGPAATDMDSGELKEGGSKTTPESSNDIDPWWQGSCKSTEYTHTKASSSSFMYILKGGTEAKSQCRLHKHCNGKRTLLACSIPWKWVAVEIRQPMWEHKTHVVTLLHGQCYL